MAIDKAVDSTVLDGYFSDIADAIRDKDGTQNTYTPAQMPTAIENIPSGSSYDWSAIGYNEEPSVIQKGYNYAVQFANNWENLNDLTDAHKNDRNLIFLPAVDMSNTTIAVRTFQGCTSLTTIPSLNMSNVVYPNYTFQNCSALIEVPPLNLSNAEATQYMFSGCACLETVGQLQTGKLSNARGMFQGCINLKNISVFDTSKLSGSNSLNGTFSECSRLTDASLDNILQMCINATSYTATKTLARLGLTSTNYPASRIEALPHYEDFIDAGWTTGF